MFFYIFNIKCKPNFCILMVLHVFKKVSANEWLNETTVFVGCVRHHKEKKEWF